MTSLDSVRASSVALKHASKEIAAFAQIISKPPDEESDICRRLSEVDDTADLLIDRVSSTSINSPLYRDLAVLDVTASPDGPLAKLDAAIHRVRDEFKYWHDLKRGSTVQAFNRNIHKVSDLFDQCGHQCLAIGKALDSAHSNTLRSSIETTADEKLSHEAVQREVLAQAEKQERSAILHWLSPFDFRSRRENLLKNCCTLGQDFQTSPVFRSWESGKRWHLKCYGDPGSGKTKLSAIIGDRLQKCYQTQNCAVVSLFLGDLHVSNDSYIVDEKSSALLDPAIVFSGSVLRQLLETGGIDTRDTWKRLRTAYQASRQSSAPPHSSCILSCLETETSSYKTVYLIVDGMDHLSRELRDVLISDLNILSPDVMNIMFTSRQIDALSDECRECSVEDCKDPEDITLYWHCDECGDEGDFDACQICVDAGKTCGKESHTLREPYEHVHLEYASPDKEMERYITWELERDIATTRLGRRLKKAPSLIKKIPSAITKKAANQFIIAKLYMDYLITKESLDDISQVLDQLPDFERAYFDAVMEGIIKTADPAIALRMLSLVSLTYRALRFDELVDALKVTDVEIPGHDRQSKKAYVLEVTGGLLIIENTEEAFVRPFHNDCKTYLAENSDRYVVSNRVDIADLCLRYLSAGAFETPCVEDETFEMERLVQHPFLAYAAQYWGLHVRDSDDESANRAAIRILGESGRVQACIQAAWNVCSSATQWDIPQGSDSLHLCAWFGLGDILDSLLDRTESTNIDVQDPIYEQTPLMFACRRSHLDLVGRLLDRGADVTSKSRKGRTPLSEAVLGENEDVISLLLDRLDGAAVNAVNEKQQDRTALMLATANEQIGRNVEAVRVLAEHEAIDINRTDRSAHSSLFLAVASKWPEAVEVLLEKEDINIMQQDTLGRSALHAAVELCDSASVEMLLQHADDHGRDDFVNLKDRICGRTALMVAVDRARSTDGNLAIESNDIIQLLLDSGADIDCTDDSGAGLLHYCATHSFADLVREFRGRELRAASSDLTGWTPLHEACRRDSCDVIQALLEDSELSMTAEDNKGRTPYRVAWQYENQEAMTALTLEAIKRGLLTAETAPSTDARPIWSVVKSGLIEKLKEAIASGMDLLETEPGTLDGALHHAVFHGNEEILEYLLREACIHPDTANHLGRTPLFQAALFGRTEAAKMLLKHNAQLEHADRWKARALTIAQSRNHFDIAIMLIEADAHLEGPSASLQELFIQAIKMKSIKALERIMQAGVDMLERDSSGRLPLQVARKVGSMEVIQILRGMNKFAHDYQVGA